MIRDELFPMKNKVQIINNRGEVIAETYNVLTTIGKRKILELFSGITSTSFDYIAVGNGISIPVGTNTALDSELARQSTFASRVGNVLTIIATFVGGVGTGTWSETGIFDAAAAGNMSNRSLFTGTNIKGVTDVWTVKWTIIA